MKNDKQVVELKLQVTVQYLQAGPFKYYTHQTSISAACEHRGLQSGTPGQARDA